MVVCTWFLSFIISIQAVFLGRRALVVCVLERSARKTSVSVDKAGFRAQGCLCAIYGTLETDLSQLTVTESSEWI